MRAIDADALDNFLFDAEMKATKQRKYVFSSALNTIRGNLAKFPTIEPERKTGKWIYEPGHIPKCSVCGIYSDDADRGYDNFCPNCGADMRGKEGKT